MAVEVQAFVLCDGVIKDAQSGKITVTGIFDRVRAQGFPAIQQKCTVYYRVILESAAGNHAVQLALTDPLGVRQMMPALAIMVNPNGLADGYIDLMGLPLSGPGNHRLDLIIDNTKRASYTLVAEQLGGVQAPPKEPDEHAN